MAKVTQDQVYEYALRLIGGRAYFSDELRTKMATRYPGEEDAIEWSIARLLDRRIVDDAKLTKSLVDSLWLDGKTGKELIRQKLLARGADEPILDELLASYEDDPSRLLTRFDPSNGREAAKAARYLIGRGFDQEVVETAIQAYFHGSAD